MKKIIIILILAIFTSGCMNVNDTDSDVNKNKDSNLKSEKSTKVKPKKFESYDSEIVPVKISIPRLNISNKLEHTGVNSDGEMEVPKDINTPEWFKEGYKVGDNGNAVIAGHVNDGQNPGVFTDLHKLKKGDEIEVEDKNHKKLIFKVYDKKLYELKKSPVEKIFGYSSNRHLNLITCEGEYNPELGSTPNRLVVYTELKSG
ncbi:class F sortase [Mammaliicoccus lentus]|uniref:class F sortase n=2 Tax=Mammaliicoccus lentus TaxID=42858 RepID=UPI002B25794A|nr:class F sortase [Mammaliicoccus lentus]WQK50224.1 class F sortase [Mammaliicoccus lentus]